MEEKIKKISFRQKNATTCPVCSNEFHIEQMFSGGGRLIAGKLTDELRRLYQESKKYGFIYPLAYQIIVCPSCLYASYPKDFKALDANEPDRLRGLTPARKNSIKKFFGQLNFNDDRNLSFGAASYMLAVDSYSIRNKRVAPTFKSAISSIRAAWLFADLSAKYPDRPYKKISIFFYKKAYNFYLKVLDIAQTGAEPIEAFGNMGPDTDKNWGYDGLLYISAVLSVKIGIKDKDIHARIENFEKSKRYLSKLFGVGKRSKDRPSELLDMTKDLYDKINELLEEWTQEIEENPTEE